MRDFIHKGARITLHAVAGEVRAAGMNSSTQYAIHGGGGFVPSQGGYVARGCDSQPYQVPSGSDENEVARPPVNTVRKVLCWPMPGRRATGRIKVRLGRMRLEKVQRRHRSSYRRDTILADTTLRRGPTTSQRNTCPSWRESRLTPCVCRVKTKTRRSEVCRCTKSKSRSFRCTTPSTWMESDCGGASTVACRLAATFIF